MKTMGKLGLAVLPVVGVMAGIALLNHFSVNAPVNKRLAESDANSVVSVKAYHRYGVLPSELVVDLRQVSGQTAPADAMRVLLWSADALKDKNFDTVILAYQGTAKLQLKGGYFKQLGEEFKFQNPVYTMRTLPENVYKMNGERAYGRWTGGMLTVMAKQLEDMHTMMQDWYLREYIDSAK